MSIRTQHILLAVNLKQDSSPKLNEINPYLCNCGNVIYKYLSNINFIFFCRKINYIYIQSFILEYTVFFHLKQYLDVSFVKSS